ncbi:MAG: hypothetical protein AAGN35_15265 [Bacteroidota bacterium]
MTSTEVLLAINSLLLGLTGILLGVVGFFLRDLHRQFKTLVGRVNTLYTELAQVGTQGSLHRETNKEEIANLKLRVNRLEDSLLRNTR